MHTQAHKTGGLTLCLNEVLAKAGGFSDALLVRRLTVSARRDQLFQRIAGAESGRSDSTRKVRTQKGDVVNLSVAQLYFTEEQLLF